MPGQLLTATEQSLRDWHSVKKAAKNEKFAALIGTVGMQKNGSRKWKVIAMEGNNRRGVSFYCISYTEIFSFCNNIGGRVFSMTMCKK